MTGREKWINIKLSRGEICVANIKAACEWCEFGQVLKLAICKNFGPIAWQAAEIIGGLLATESQSDRVTDTQGYSVYGWVKLFCA